MLNEVQEILRKRKAINDEDDYNIEKCRNILIKKMSQNAKETILILNQLGADEILYVSEVFEEIAYNLQSLEYINCLKSISNKYPDLELQDSIEVAEEYMN